MSIKLPKSKKGKIILGIGIFIIFLVAFFGYLFYQGIKESPKIGMKVTEFLQNVSSGNIDSAYSQTSEEFKKEVSIEDLKFLATEGTAQYSGFQSQKQTGFRVNKNTDSPTIYSYFGEITYDIGDKGYVEAKLVKENGDYKIFYIYVDVSIDRLKMFGQQEKNSVLGASSE